MKCNAYAVKTRYGKIYAGWTFDEKREADEFAEELNESNYPHKYDVVPVVIETVKEDTKTEI